MSAERDVSAFLFGVGVYGVKRGEGWRPCLYVQFYERLLSCAWGAARSMGTRAYLPLKCGQHDEIP